MNDTETNFNDYCDGCGKASAELTHADDGTFCADCIKARDDVDMIAEIERLMRDVSRASVKVNVVSRNAAFALNRAWVGLEEARNFLAKL